MKKKDHFLWTRLLMLTAVLVLEANSFSQEMFALNRRFEQRKAGNLIQGVIKPVPHSIGTALQCCFQL